MAIYKTETITDSWEFLSHYKRIKRNKITKSESLLGYGKYIPSYTGIYRVGRKISELDSTYDIIEDTVLVLKPNISRIYIGSSTPYSASFRVYFSSVILNEGEFSCSLTLKPWANSGYIDWESSTTVSYEDIVDYYIPFNLDASTYTSSVYEKTFSNITTGTTSALYTGIKELFYSFLKENIIGFVLIGNNNGYINVFNSNYLQLDTVKPQFLISQTIPYCGQYYSKLDIEISGKSHVIGACRNRNGELIAGSQSKIAIYDIDSHNLIGSGLSDLNGGFRIQTKCKSYDKVLVTFVNETENINGCEIMTTFASSSSSSSSFSDSSSSSSVS